MLFEKESYREFLNEELTRRLRVNPRYSQRAFAKYLGLSPGELSELLNGKRKMSLKTSTKIAKALNFGNAESQHLLSWIQKESGGIQEKPKLSSRRLSEAEFAVLSNWYCLALLCLTECEGFKWSVTYISKRLAISSHEVKYALNCLEKAGLIFRKGSAYQISKDFIETTDGIPSEAIRQYHKQILEKAVRAVECQPADKRDIKGLGLAMDPKYIGEIKKDIAGFLETLFQKYGTSGKKKEIYQCEIAFFKLTEGEQ